MKIDILPVQNKHQEIYFAVVIYDDNDELKTLKRFDTFELAEYYVYLILNQKSPE